MFYNYLDHDHILVLFVWEPIHLDWSLTIKMVYGI
jgi:hypothetical protein